MGARQVGFEGIREFHELIGGPGPRDGPPTPAHDEAYGYLDTIANNQRNFFDRMNGTGPDDPNNLVALHLTNTQQVNDIILKNLMPPPAQAPRPRLDDPNYNFMAQVVINNIPVAAPFALMNDVELENPINPRRTMKG